MRPAIAALVAGLIGFAVMGLELTAVRLFAPYFGDSAYVWTNVIGVVMVALAVGAFLGGRMADRDHGRERLFVLLLIGGLLVAVVPLAAGPLGRWLVPADLPLDSAMGALVRGSLVATAALFGPPVVLVACSSPMLVTLLARVDGKIGRASGLVSSTATIGSLLGTFAATHLMIPWWGSRETVWICAGFLIVAALLCRVRVTGGAALLALFGLPLLAPAHLRGVAAGEELLAEVESNYQFLQVVRSGDAEPPFTHLKINEGLDSFHSVAYDGTPYTLGSYYDYHVVMPFLAGQGVAPPKLRVLSLGEAAGTFGRLFAHVHKVCSMDAVEIDPAVMRLGDAHFPAGRPEGQRFALDARVFVENTERRYDVVLVDTYKNQIYVPSHMASEQFFRAVHNVLKDGGVVSVNAGGTRFTDPVIQAMCSTMAAVFGVASAFRVPNSRNFVLAARKGGPLRPDDLGKVETTDPELQKILARMGRAAVWREFQRGRVVLDDNRPFLDRLQEQVYSRVESHPELIPIAGSRPAATVYPEVVGMYQQGRIEDALVAIRSADQATANLRLFAGHCRWMLRDAGGAVQEYEEAKRLGVEAPSIDGNIEGAQAEYASRLAAWEVGSRNGWLALVVAGVMLVGAVLLRGW